MAIIKLGGGITDAQGSVGGLTFQKGRSGHIIRNKPSFVNRNTALQGSRRAILNRLQGYWIGLSDANRASWELARSFTPILQNNISGRFINAREYFIRQNYYRLAYNLSIKSAFIPTPYTTAPRAVTVARFGAIFSVDVEPNLGFISHTLILYLSRSVQPTLNNPGSRLRLIPVVTGISDPYDITSVYEAIFGIVPNADDTIFIKWAIAEKATGVIGMFTQEKQTVRLIT